MSSLKEVITASKLWKQIVMASFWRCFSLTIQIQRYFLDPKGILELMGRWVESKTKQHSKKTRWRQQNTWDRSKGLRVATSHSSCIALLLSCFLTLPLVLTLNKYKWLCNTKALWKSGRHKQEKHFVSPIMGGSLHQIGLVTCQWTTALSNVSGKMCVCILHRWSVISLPVS